MPPIAARILTTSWPTLRDLNGETHPLWLAELWPSSGSFLVPKDLRVLGGFHSAVALTCDHEPQ